MSAQFDSIGQDPAGGEFFSADDFLINIVKRAVKNEQNIQICHKGEGCITILSSAGEYFDHTDNIQRFCITPASQLTVTILSQKDIESMPADIGRNIDELMWMAGFYASDGRLLEGCFRDDVVELMHWPNLTRLPSTANTMRIASLLSRHPTSITLAQKFLGVSFNELYQFYSAARCAGLARAVNRTPVEPSLKPHRNQALLSLLLNKIARV